MRKLFALVAALVSSFAAFAYEPAIRDINISVLLHNDGSASINEKWNVTVASGTEWYLTRKNLGDIDISGLQVSDESGTQFKNVGEWDIDKSIWEKKSTCGIVHKDDGMELCWGVGSMGDHTFNVSYTMTNVVKSLNDYDCLHVQLLSPGLSSDPQHVLVTIAAEGVQIDTANTRAWGFGFKGNVNFADGKVTLETTESIPTDDNGSVIAMLRFNKGIFNPSSVQDKNFQDELDIAMQGASFGDNEEESVFDKIFKAFFSLLSFFLVFILPSILIFRKNHVSRKARRKILEMDPKDIQWYREIPLDGDIVASDYVLTRLGEDRKSNSLASALILRMIYKGNLSVGKDAGGKVVISFNNDSGLDDTGKGLYNLMLRASGDDKILQDKEFSRWSRRHTSSVTGWIDEISFTGISSMQEKGELIGKNFTAKGHEQARNLMGFKKFLSDFTLMGEKNVIEVNLWQDYLVFGALFGIASKVAKQLHDIDPQIFEETMDYDFDTLTNVILVSTMLSHSITNTAASAATGSWSGGGGGFGGGTSFGGGGGFSGGGFGGGSR